MKIYKMFNFNIKGLEIEYMVGQQKFILKLKNLKNIYA